MLIRIRYNHSKAKVIWAISTLSNFSSNFLFVSKLLFHLPYLRKKSFLWTLNSGGGEHYRRPFQHKFGANVLLLLYATLHIYFQIGEHPPPKKKKKKYLNYLLIKYIFLVIATAANANKIFPVQFFAMVSLTHFSPRRKTYGIEMWYWAKMGSLTRKRRCYANVLLSISKIFYKKKPVNGKRSMLLIVILSFRTFNHWGNHFIISTKQVVLRF